MNKKGLISIILIIILLAIIAIGGGFIISKKSPLSSQPTNSQPSQQVPPSTTIQENAPISSVVITSFDEEIAACYTKNEEPILNNSVQRVLETTRRFVNVPKDFYPKEISSYFTTVSGNATAGWISNGGLPGEGLDATSECWSTYYQFDGNGEVDLRVRNEKKGVPDYFVRFIVSPSQ